MHRMAPQLAGSIANIALSLEAVALRVRGSIGRDNADRVLEWSRLELERIGKEAQAAAAEARVEEREEAKR